MNTDAAVQAVTLDARLQMGEKELKITYLVANHSDHDIYVLDVLPGYNLESKKVFPNPDAVYICYRPGPDVDATAYMLRGSPPHPADRAMLRPIMALGTKVSAGATVEHAFTVALPLMETSPYYLPLKDEEYKAVKIRRVVLGVQYMPATAEKFKAEPWPFGPGLFKVSSRATHLDSLTLTHEFHVPELTLLKRCDNFTRL